MKSSQNEYKTKDLGEASAFLVKGIKLLRLEKDSNFYWFVFEYLSSIDLSNLYWSGELQVPAKDYYDKMRSLKDRLFAQK